MLVPAVCEAHGLGDSLFALVPALVGMISGQRLLRVMRPETFRRWFFSGLAVLGAHLVLEMLW